MEKKIFCHIDMFSNEHQIMKINEDCSQTKIGSCSLAEMPNTLCGLCDEYDVNNVHLFGIGYILDNLKTDIERVNMIKFSDRKINVEVN